MKMFTRQVARGMAATAVTGGLALGFAAAAGAATLPPQGPSSTPPAAGGSNSGTFNWNGSNPTGSTTGFNLINQSAETLDFVSVSGSLPAPSTAPLSVGQSDNFEIDNPFWSTKSGSALFNVMGPDGAQIGTLTLSVNSDGSWSTDFETMSGQQLTTMESEQGENDWDNIYIEDVAGSPNSAQTLAAGSAAEQAFLQATTEKGIGSSKFSNITETKQWSAPTLIAQGYNGQSVQDTLQTGSSYDFQTTDTWGASVSAGAELGAFSAGVDASYSHAVTKSTSEDISDAAPVLPGDTTYIWGSVWQYVDTGTMTVTIGNTTWTLPGVTVYSAVPDANVMYSTSEVTGDVPLPPGTIQTSGGTLINPATGAAVNS